MKNGTIKKSNLMKSVIAIILMCTMILSVIQAIGAESLTMIKDASSESMDDGIASDTVGMMKVEYSLWIIVIGQMPITQTNLVSTSPEG